MEEPWSAAQISVGDSIDVFLRGRLVTPYLSSGRYPSESPIMLLSLNARAFARVFCRLAATTKPDPFVACARVHTAHAIHLMLLLYVNIFIY